MFKQIFFILAVLVAFQYTEAMSKKPVQEKPVVVTPTPTPSPNPSPVPQKGAGIESIKNITVGSACSKFSYKDQGKPKLAYLQGLSLTFARSLCNKSRADVVAASSPVGDASKDVLAHYSHELRSLSIINSSDTDRLRNVYTFLIGSAARESSWRWCAGKDPGAKNDDSETCETGLYQTSWNSRSANRAVLPNLFYSYKSTTKGCFFDVYSEGITCSASNLKNYGTGEGLQFQHASKYCPGFASEYAAVMFRFGRKHYGPLNTKKVQFVPACNQMLLQVQNLIESNKSICNDL